MRPVSSPARYGASPFSTMHALYTALRARKYASASPGSGYSRCARAMHFSIVASLFGESAAAVREATPNKVIPNINTNTHAFAVCIVHLLRNPRWPRLRPLSPQFGDRFKKSFVDFAAIGTCMLISVPPLSHLVRPSSRLVCMCPGTLAHRFRVGARQHPPTTRPRSRN